MAPNPTPGDGRQRPARPETAGPGTAAGLGTDGRPEARIEITGEVGALAAAAVLGLADAAAQADGISPLSEQVRLHLRHGGGRAERNLLLWQGTGLAGYAHLSAPGQDGGRSGELVVHPASRGQGLGRALARAAVDQTAVDQTAVDQVGPGAQRAGNGTGRSPASPEAEPGQASPGTHRAGNTKERDQASPEAEPGQAGQGPLRIWAHGDLPAAAGLAAVAGFRRVRALWMMRRSLAGPLGEPRFPPEVTVRTFTPGEDEEQWLAVNARAFASHPEQGAWTTADLLHREREPWFDPAGFFLAERGGKLAGFHWTKVHPPGMTREETGEVYVVGVDPSEQGTGLGRALTLAGLRHLRERGVPDVMLYVDEDNPGAVRLYASLGFTHEGTDVMYEHHGSAIA